MTAVKLPLETAIELNAALDQIYMQATRLKRASDNKCYLIGDLEIINEISQHDIYEVLKAAAEELERLRDQPPARGTPWL